MAVQRLRNEGEYKFALDFRPHSHHYHVMERVRGSATESGTIETGGAILCGFMTSWGDGIFPVEPDLDAEGRLVRLRVELGCNAIVARQRRFEEWWWGAFARTGVVSRRVFEEGQCVRFLCREGPDDEDDSGWRLFAGGERRSYCDDAANFQTCPLRELIQRDRGLEELLRVPAGLVFERERCDGEFRPVDDFDVSKLDE